MIHKLKTRASAFSAVAVLSLSAATGFLGSVGTQHVFAESSNYITNSGFESPSNLSGWTNLAGNLTLSTTVSHSGSQSAYATVTPGSSSNTQVLNDSPNWLTTPTDDWVHDSIWVKGVSGGIVTLSNANGWSTVVTLSSSDWTQVSYVFDNTVMSNQIPADNEFQVNYRQPDSGQSGTIYMDDASMTTGTDSASCGDPVYNCGFEYPYGVEGWNTAGSDSTSNVSLGTTADSHDGSSAALLTRTASTSGTISLNDSPDYLNGANMSGKTSCTATAWVKSSSTSGNVKISLTQSGTGGSGQAVSSYTPSTSWQQITVTQTNGNGGGMDWKIYQTSVPQNGTLTIDTANESCS